MLIHPSLRVWGLGLLVAIIILILLPSANAAVTPMAGPEILQQLKSFVQWGSVLYVAAHPDDENTLLIAYLARGRNYRTAYLSVTRGDGGQNLLGPEFGEALGVARTQELLAARRLDGGRQFFTRAIDFGFSKDYRETLNIWDHRQVVADMVRVIRTFRPDVIITRFSLQPGGTHGHHTASAVLALEAFRLAGQATAFPDQLATLGAWQAKRIFCNSRGDSDTGTTLHLEIAGNDPVSGLAFGDLAARSRAMHKTQGFGNFGGGGGGNRGRTENFQLLDGQPASQDIMDGVDTTWNRVPGGAAIGQLAGDIIGHFDVQRPAASVPALLQLRALVLILNSADPLVLEKSAQLDHILQSCLGLSVQTTVTTAEAVPGESLLLQHSASVESGVEVSWLGVRHPLLHDDLSSGLPAPLSPAKPAAFAETVRLPLNTPVSQPYWLRQPGRPGMFTVADSALIGCPENPPVFPLEQVFTVGGQTLVIPDEPILAASELEPGHARRLLAIPPASLHFVNPVVLFKPGGARAVSVRVTSHRANARGFLQLIVPPNWRVEPVRQSIVLDAARDQSNLQFTVTAPAVPEVGEITAQANIGGAYFNTDRLEINYPHVPFQLLQRVAAMKAVSLALQTRGRAIGYLAGAGDSVADSLVQMGYTVTQLTDADLTPEKLRALDAVVIGVRAFNVRANLNPHLSALFDYVQAGGTLVEQYNRPDGLKTDRLAPYDLKLSGSRVTDENAAVTFLAPEHPVLNTPNKITPEDFTGWVQERGIYFPSQWDDHFTPILACHDAGEEPLKGSLLVAPYGKGRVVYTGLVFFRQLPAGVPGAWRLFANLVSLGK